MKLYRNSCFRGMQGTDPELSRPLSGFSSNSTVSLSHRECALSLGPSSPMAGLYLMSIQTPDLATHPDIKPQGPPF